jgi:Methyltransferase domain
VVEKSSLLWDGTVPPGDLLSKASWKPWQKSLFISGWMTYPELEWLYERSLTMDSIIEIGSWNGRSTYSLCSGCKGTVYAIDPFRVAKSAKWLVDEGLCRTNFDIFASNMDEFNNIKLFKGTSKQAARSRLLPKKVDMIFIDANHDYEFVLADLKLWSKRATKLLCGHDLNMAGVYRAVDEFFGIENVEHISDNIWAINWEEKNGED